MSYSNGFCSPICKPFLNVKIKFREPFRPFVPSVLAERTEDYFVLPEAARHYPGRFMLYVVEVRDDQRHIIPAVTHVDGTGRLQTVHQGVSPRYYRLIDIFGKATGGRPYIPEWINLMWTDLAVMDPEY